MSSGTSSNLECELSEEYDLTIKIGSWVLVAYRSKKSVRRFVGVIESKSQEGDWFVKFARHVEGSKFKWPECEDISTIDDEQIDRKLLLPTFQEKMIESLVLCLKKNLKDSASSKVVHDM